MKNLTLIIFVFLCLILNNQAFCQSHYGAYFSSDNQYVCPNNQPVKYFLFCSTDFSYNPTDSISLLLEYGDGQDTTVYMHPANFMELFYMSHSYTNTGVYFAKFTALDINKFKVEQSLEIIIGNSCTNISGQIYHEINNDCTFQGSDSVYYRKGVIVTLSHNGNFISSKYCDGAGKYIFSKVPAGYVYILQPFLDDSTDGVTCHTDFCPPFRVESTLPDSFADFGLMSNLNTYDLHGYIFTPGIRPAGGKGIVVVDVFNSSCKHPVSGFVKVYSNPPLTLNSCDQSFTKSGDTMIVQFGKIPGTTKGFEAHIVAFSPGGSKSGDSVHLYLEIYPTDSDANPANNTADFISTYKNSLDPNEKYISTAGWSYGNEIKTNTVLNYMITFQNTGTAPAINIELIDTLDNNLDINTFHFNSSSHYCSYTFLEGNIIKFMFPGINLPDSTSNMAKSSANVSYSILPKSNLLPGNIIHNSAAIVFDKNTPVITNTVISKIFMPVSVKQDYPGSNELIDIYPVPFKDVFYINVKKSQRNISMEIYDGVGGRLVLKSDHIHSGINTIQTGQIRSGLFLLRFFDSDNNVIQSNIIVSE